MSGETPRRTEGRRKLYDLLDEAMKVCREYEHAEYAPDFHEIKRGLMHDRALLACKTAPTE